MVKRLGRRCCNRLAEFVQSNVENLKRHKPENIEFRDWASCISDWLYNTNQIHVGCSLPYAGVEVEQDVTDFVEPDRDGVAKHAPDADAVVQLDMRHLVRGDRLCDAARRQHQSAKHTGE